MKSLTSTSALLLSTSPSSLRSSLLPTLRPLYRARLLNKLNLVFKLITTCSNLILNLNTYLYWNELKYVNCYWFCREDWEMELAGQSLQTMCLTPLLSVLAFWARGFSRLLTRRMMMVNPRLILLMQGLLSWELSASFRILIGWWGFSYCIFIIFCSTFEFWV